MEVHLSSKNASFLSTGTTSSTSSVAPISAENSGNPELAMQGLSYLGYLGMLCSPNASPNPEQQQIVNAEIARVTAILFNLAPQLQDGTAKTLIEAGLKQIGQNDQAYEAWWLNGDPSTSPSLQVFQYIQKNPYTFTSSTSPDTFFATLMLMTSLGQQFGSFGTLNQFMGEGSFGGQFTGAEYMAFFLNAYCKANPNVLSESVLKAILPQDSNSSFSYYDEFLGDINPNWTPKGGASAQDVEAGVASFVAIFFNQLNSNN